MPPAEFIRLLYVINLHEVSAGVNEYATMVHMKKNVMEICPYYEQAAGILGKRWTPLILLTLMDGPKRFTQLASISGISAKVLAERMKELEESGIIIRTVFSETPVRIEYSLSDKGRALKPVLDEIQRWANGWLKPGKTKTGRRQSL